MTTRRTRVLLLVAATSTLSALALAGPLNPPTGPVATSGKPLSEVEPRTAINSVNTPGDANSSFKITQPGSYYLTGNLAGAAGKYGIKITCSGVTVDLCGFEAMGVPGSLAGVATADTSVSIYNVTIRNGTVREWGGVGVTTSAMNARIERISALGNAGGGIGVMHNAAISNCTLTSNGGDGIQGSENISVTDCTIWSSTFGIRVGLGSIVSRCNTAHCGTGINAGNSTISDCTASNCTGSGITASGSSITRCTASFNTGDGISTSTGGNITACVATFNASDGIQASAGASITGCTVSNNSVHGINIVGGACVVRDNVCRSNGPNAFGAGINVGATSQILGTGARIENNNVDNSYYGIQITNAGNMVLRNTCRGCSYPWQIAVGNSMGAIVNATTNATAIEGGGTGAPSTLSTDPNANYSY